jgi:hypothetical protein
MRIRSTFDLQHETLAAHAGHPTRISGSQNRESVNLREISVYRIDMSAGAFATGLTRDEFRNEFISRCEQHHAAGRALVFGAIVYSFKDVYVIKALQDRDYWSALDELTGRYASVFVFYSPITDPKGPEDFWKEDETNEARAALAEIGNFFLQGEPLKLPAIIFFQVDNGRVIDGAAVALSADSLESSFREIRNIVQTVSAALRQVSQENRDNAAPIFGLVKTALSERSLHLKVRNWAKKVLDGYRVASLFGRLAGF